MQRPDRCAILAALITVCILCSTAAAETPAGDPFVAVVITVGESVQVLRANAEGRETLKLNDRLYPGDRVITGEGGRASLIFADNAVEVKLMPDTELLLQGQRSNGGVVKRAYLALGKLLTKVLRGDMEVATPTCVASVKGTRWWTTVDAASGTRVIVLDGEVEVASSLSDERATVAAGSTATASPGGEVQVNPTQEDELPASDEDFPRSSLEVQFEDASGLERTLQIDFER